MPPLTGLDRTLVGPPGYKHGGPTGPFRTARETVAFTLIQVIGALAVLSILVAVLLPALLKSIDKSVSDKEKATMATLGDAFQRYVLTTRTVPDQTTWYSAIAATLGVGTNDILYNVRQQSRTQPRVFLIDPSLSLGQGSGLPYTQSSYVTNTSNWPQIPVNPRVMVVSTLGSALPSSVASGVYTSGHPEYFSNLWAAADGTVPSDTPWTGWTGNSADVIVQRINLAPLFVHLLLGTYASSPLGAYTLDNNPISPVAVGTADGYFIQGSVLGLYTNSTGISTQQILTRSTSFLYDHNVWRGSISGSVLGPGVMNIGDVVMQFLNSPNNVNAANPAGNAQQQSVVNNMLSYMSNYNVWAYQYGFTNAGMKAYLRSIQPGLVSSIQGLYQNSHFPTNPAPCVQ
jgi:type II secretory pathway pseudopilin PulG